MADDFLSKKKENGPILDLSKATCNTKEDLKKLLDKVPDFKIRPVKVRTEEIKIKDKDFKFKTSKKDLKVLNESYNFANPIPTEMRTVNLQDLIAVPIDWRMLTTLRPKLKLDEDYFSRLVELGKSEVKTRQQNKRTPPETFIRKSKNKNGVVETKIVACAECQEEFCDGKTCNLFSYDSFARVNAAVEHKTIVPEQSQQQKDKTKKKRASSKRRSRSKTKGKTRRSKSKSKSPAKSTSRKSAKNKSK